MTVIALGVSTGGVAHAVLVDRGGGLIYDTVLDVTWLQDANYAFTLGYPSLGQLSWPDAMAWVDQLTYFDSVRGVTWSDWHLPSIAPLNGVAFQLGTSTSGNTDDGYNISAAGTLYAGSTASSLAYMYYNNLGNVARCPVTGWAFCSTSPVTLNAGPFSNLFAAGYWFGSDEGLPFAPPDAWAFDMGDAYGVQGGWNGEAKRGAWAVMNGDVASLVPEANSRLMWGFGLSFFAIGTWLKRRARQVPIALTLSGPNHQLP